MLSRAGARHSENAAEESHDQAIDAGERSGFGQSEAPHTDEMRVIVTTSLAPPSPLASAAACETPIGTLDTLYCRAEGPRALVSYPPPSAAVGCGLGTVIDGRYKIESILGEGGMGIVYLARHRIIDKRVAVKVLRRDFAHDPDIAERFLFEAKAASSIGNPHIVDISDFGRLPDGATYFVMEWLDGSPLSTLVADGQRVPVARIISIGRQIAEALFAAHQQDIVHRDLKADNVFLVKRGNEPDFVKILDFGIAKVTSGESAQKKTQMGALFGTPHYMSPEQASGGTVDCRTDVYGLGVILYELASGRLPFEGNSLMEILTQHMYRAPVPIRALVQAPDIPSGLEAIILKALSKRPDQRYATMQDFGRDLERLGNGETPHALVEMRARSASAFPPSILPEAMPLPIPARPRRSGRTRWDVYAGMTAILMACSLTLGVFLHAENGKAQVAQVSPAAEGPASSAVAAHPSSDPMATAPNAEIAKADVTNVLFAADPLDAHVLRGGVDLGSTPLTIDVPKGQRVSLEVRRAGFVSRAVELDGSEKRISLKLAPVPDLRPRNIQRTKRSKGSQRGGEIVNPWAN